MLWTCQTYWKVCLVFINKIGLDLCILGGQFWHLLMEVVTMVFGFFFSWGCCLCLEGSFLNGAADCGQMATLKAKAWDEGVCSQWEAWEGARALWHGAHYIFLIWDNPGVPSVRQPLTNEQGSDHLKWFSWLCWLQEVFSMVLQRAWWNKIYLQLAF